jgi:hypothetical protein
MFLKAGMLIILGFLCLVGVVLAIVFTIIGFANNKTHKYSWLTAFFVCLIGMIMCIYLFINKTVNKIQSLTDEFGNQIEQSMQNMSDSLSHSNDDLLQTNEHLQKLKSYDADSMTIPNQFYTYLGFESYYRFPLRYPYSIHCSPFRDNGELFNERNVIQFDINDNGESTTNIINISKLALDKTYLLLEQSITSTRSNKVEKKYLLFSFDTGQKEEATSEKELVKLAQTKGFKGSNTLMTIEDYDLLLK